MWMFLLFLFIYNLFFRIAHLLPEVLKGNTLNSFFFFLENYNTTEVV